MVNLSLSKTSLSTSPKKYASTWLNLGYRTVDEMVGQVDRLETKKAVNHWKAAGLDFTNILQSQHREPGDEIYCVNEQDHGLEKSSRYDQAGAVE